LDHLGAWDEVLPLIEFTYNNSFHASIGMAPYEAFCGRRCRTPLYWYQDGEAVLVGPELLEQTTEKVRTVRNRCRLLSVGRRPMQTVGGDLWTLQLVIMNS